MFNINGEEWHIKYVHPSHPKLINSNGDYTLGSCDDIDKTVYINRNLSDEKLFKVLCHEITHCAMFSYDVILSAEQEEILADLIATYGQEIISITNNIFARIKGFR